MKRITRLIRAGDEAGARVWLDGNGSWTKDPDQAFEFEDAEAEKRLKRLPHAETEDAKKDSK
jgi:hypothetical protein